MTTKDIEFWLNDRELKTPEHDKMVLWCFNNSEKIINDLNLIPKRKTEIKFIPNEELGTGHYYYHSYNRKFEIDEKNYTIIIKKDSSHSKEKEKLKEEMERLKKEIDDDYKLILLKIKENDEKKSFYLFDKKIEFSLYRGNWNIGFIDLKIELKNKTIQSKYFYEYDKLEDYHTFYLEIKPKIDSFGEVMRQINFYRDYIQERNHKFILITKTKGFKELFESQNVYVYEID